MSCRGFPHGRLGNARAPARASRERARVWSRCTVLVAIVAASIGALVGRRMAGRPTSKAPIPQLERRATLQQVGVAASAVGTIHHGAMGLAARS
jgi:hypothetical protein